MTMAHLVCTMNRLTHRYGVDLRDFQDQLGSMPLGRIAMTSLGLDARAGGRRPGRYWRESVLLYEHGSLLACEHWREIVDQVRIFRLHARERRMGSLAGIDEQIGEVLPGGSRRSRMGYRIAGRPLEPVSTID